MVCTVHLFSFQWNGMEWFGRLRCCWEIDEMRRTVCDDNSIHVVAHTHLNHITFTSSYTKKKQQKNQPNNNNNNRDKKNSGNRIDFTWFIVAHVTESKLCVLCSCDAHAWNCDENLSFSHSLWFLLNNLQQKMEKWTRENFGKASIHTHTRTPTLRFDEDTAKRINNKRVIEPIKETKFNCKTKCALA